MSITQDDFKKIWASTSSVPEYTFSDSDYQDGWEFVGNLPPTRAMWDTLQRRNDQKMKYLQDNGSMCFDSVADMVASNLDAGQTVLTKGYHTVNDGGSALYTIRAKDVADVEDDGSIIFLDNGNVAELITDGTVNVKQFGAYGDNTHDDTDAIVAAGTYCATKNIILTSDKASYKTTTDCIISMVQSVQLNGDFTFLELRYNPSTANVNVQHIHGCGNLILRDYKGATFTIDYVPYELQIIADEAVRTGSSFAYNTFLGGWIGKLSLIGGATGGWINENRFYGTYFNVIEIGTHGDSYSHNNNRFYDAVLEGASAKIVLDKATNNYFQYRNEGGPAITTTANSFNNIFEKTWMSTIGGARYQAISSENFNITAASSYKYLNRSTLLHLDINNAPWNDNHVFSKDTFYFRAWSSLGYALIELTGDIYINGSNLPGLRFSIEQLDENMQNVPNTVESLVISTLSYNSTTNSWVSGTNMDTIGASITKPSSPTTKYIKITISKGSGHEYFTGAFDIYAFVAGVSCSIMKQQSKVPFSATVPTLTTDVPKGFEVLNTGTNTAIWKWVFNGTSWVAVNYPT